MNLKKNYASLGLALALLAFAPNSSSAFTITLDGTTATGILNLDVDGTFYDVTFPKIEGAFLYGGAGSAVFQFPTIESTEAAVSAVVAALNLYNTTNPDLESVGDSSSALDRGPVFHVGWADDNAMPPADISACAPPIDNPCIQTVNGIWKTTTNLWSAPDGAEYIAFDDATNYADFQVVPEPGTALLMGLGLAGLAAIRRK